MCVERFDTRYNIYVCIYKKKHTRKTKKKIGTEGQMCEEGCFGECRLFNNIFVCCVIGLSWFIAASSFSCDLLRLHRHIYINNSYFACQLMLFHLSLMLCCNSVAFIRFDVILLRAAISNGYFAVNAYAARVERLFSFNELGGHQIQR